MHPTIEHELTRQTEVEARRAAVQARRLLDLERYAGAKARPELDVAIREAQASDMPELIELAELDSRPLPSGNLLVAEADGRIRAAVAVDSDDVIADPFVPTAELKSLLVLRAQQLRRERWVARGGLLAALHLRPGRAA